MYYYTILYMEISSRDKQKKNSTVCEVAAAVAGKTKDTKENEKKTKSNKYKMKKKKT